MSCLYQHAEPAAQRIVDALVPVCDKIEIAGSIRRRKPVVKDIEIVCVPSCAGLFGDTPDYERFEMAIGQAIAAGIFAYDPDLPRDGDKYKRLRIVGADPMSYMAVDLFIALPGNFGNIFAIRTGNSRFSQLLVTRRSQRILCDGANEDSLWHYGLMPDDMRQIDGFLTRGGKAIDCPDEAYFFGALGLPVPVPEKRNLATIEELRRLSI